MKITDYLKHHIVYLDGGMGTLLQAQGLKPGEHFKKMVARARQVHFAGIEKSKALKQILGEYRTGMFE